MPHGPITPWAATWPTHFGLFLHLSTWFQFHALSSTICLWFNPVMPDGRRGSSERWCAQRISTQLMYVPFLRMHISCILRGRIVFLSVPDRTWNLNEIYLAYRLPSVIHCQYRKYIVYVTCSICNTTAAARRHTHIYVIHSIVFSFCTDNWRQISGMIFVPP